MPNIIKANGSGAARESRNPVTGFVERTLKLDELPMGLTKIGDYAFEECNDLVEITIPDSVKEIALFAFANCRKLKSVTIGNGLEVLNDAVFLNCPSLETVRIGSGIQRINTPFQECPSLKTIIIDRKENAVTGADWWGNGAEIIWTGSN